MVQNTESKPIVKIIVKLPLNAIKFAESFPFLIALWAKFPESEIGVIAQFQDLTMTQLLPFKVFAHPITNEIKGPFDIHHYAYNLHSVFNVDYYFDLDGTFDSAFLGFCLRAKRRIGKDGELKKFFYTDKVKGFGSGPLYSEALKLLQVLDGEEIKVENPLTIKNFSPYFEDYSNNPYLCFNLESFSETNTFTPEQLKELFDYFEFQNIVLLGNDKHQGTAEAVVQQANKKNKYRVLCQDKMSWFEKLKVSRYALGFFTRDSALAHLNSFADGRTLIIYNGEAANDKIPQFGRGIYRFVDKFEISRIIDTAYELFPLKKEEGPVTGPQLKLIKNESE